MLLRIPTCLLSISHAADNDQPRTYTHLSFPCPATAVGLAMMLHALQGFAAVSVCPDPTEASVTVMHHSGIGTMQVSGTIPSLEEFGV